MKIFYAAILVALGFGSVGLAQGLNIDLPGTNDLTSQLNEPSREIALPSTAVEEFGEADQTVQGDVIRMSWRLPQSDLTPLQLMNQLRPQISQAGYEEVFECDAQTCGGFDFRFALDLISEPHMHVDIGNYRYLLASHGEENPVWVAFLASRSNDAAYLHMTEVVPSGDMVTPLIPAVQGDPKDLLIANLEAQGRVVLSDLEFQTGSSALDQGPFPSLEVLAEYLAAHPDKNIILVGHTDDEGTLDGNITLSRARADSVRRELIDVFGTDASQVSAEGIGFLMPLALNDTPEGRDQNRRVEAVLPRLNP